MRLDHLLSKRKGKYRCTVQRRWHDEPSVFVTGCQSHGDLAQLARASALQAEGQGFKSPNLQIRGGAARPSFMMFEMYREGMQVNIIVR